LRARSPITGTDGAGDGDPEDDAFGEGSTDEEGEDGEVGDGEDGFGEADGWAVMGLLVADGGSDGRAARRPGAPDAEREHHGGMNAMTRTLGAGRRLGRQAAETSFENPAVLGVAILAGLTILWAILGNVYGIVSSLIAMGLTMLIAVRYTRR
jgi:hypothetical protein